MDKIELEHDKEKGEAFAYENSVLILSRGNLAYLQREFEKIIGPAATYLVYDSARMYAQSSGSNIKGDITRIGPDISKEDLGKILMDHFSEHGYGCGEITEMDLSVPRVKIKVTNSANTMGYKESEKPVCHFIRGIFAGAVTVALERSMHCVETKCTAKGDPQCEFEIITAEEMEKRRLGEV